MDLLFFGHESALAHDTGPGHPERAERYAAIIRAVDRLDAPWLLRQEAPPATLEQLLRVHDRDYVEATLAHMPTDGLVRFDPDTVASPGTREAVLRAAGAVVAGVDAVMAGTVKRCFSAMRPPGHHAERRRAMGFCFFDSIAVGAAHARAVHGVRRLAIVDFDVHHGNGTQDIVWNDPDTLYVSTHQAPLFPGTGSAAERGAAGNVLNVPLAPGTDGQAFEEAVESRVLPALDRFAPELLLISAGFDAHRADPLASLELVEGDFDWITRELVTIAERHAAGRVVSVLEGGYDTAALARCVVGHLRALAGEE